MISSRAVLGSVLRAPFSARPWREQAYVLAGLLPAVPAFALALLAVPATALSLLTVGLPVLVLVLFAARQAPRAFLPVARRLLGVQWPLPSPLRRTRNPLRWGAALLADGAAWRGLLYGLLKLPLTATAAYLGTVAIVVGSLALTHPVWWLVWPTAFGLIEPHSWAASWVLAVQGAGVLLAWPWFLRLVVALDTLLVRALLEPGASETRIAALESGRAVLTADAAASVRRLERDLHDGTQARLVSIGVSLSRIQHRVSDPTVRALVDDAQATLTDALTELRGIVRGLHPPALDDGLQTALTTLAARSAVPTQVDVALAHRPSDATATALYFTAAELLANVARHAGAGRARLRLTCDGDFVHLAVEDDGRGGAQLSPPASGTGLAGLTRRAEALDGVLSVISPVGGPTTVTMTLPRDVACER